MRAHADTVAGADGRVRIQNREEADERSYDADELQAIVDKIPLMTHAQREIYDAVLTDVDTARADRIR